MNKRSLTAIALSGVVIGLLYLGNRYGFRTTPPQTVAPGDPQTSREQIGSERQSAARVELVRPTDDLNRFATEVLPVAQDFLKRIQSLAPYGIVAPFSGPITTNRLTKVRFEGGPTNTVCTFIIDKHSVFGYHAVNRNGKEWKGIHSFGRAGTDETGMPLNLDQLIADPSKNARYIKMLADSSRYPARSLKETAPLAQRVLAVLRPQEAPLYSLAESWAERVGTSPLPFYTFIYPGNGPAKTEPYNLMRDENVVRLQSTTAGLVLDYFEDTSVAFKGGK